MFLRVTTSLDGFADARALAQRPDADFPGREILGHVERDLGQAVGVGVERRDPQGGVGKFGAERRFDGRGGRRFGLHCRQTGPRPSDRSFFASAIIGAAAGSRHAPREAHAEAIRRPRPSARHVLRRRSLTAARLSHPPPSRRTRRYSASASASGGVRFDAPAVEARFLVRLVLPPPLPEELFDVGHVRSARDVLDALVEDREHGRADERLAGFVGELQFHRGVLAGLVDVGRRHDVDVENPLGRAARGFRRPACGRGRRRRSPLRRRSSACPRPSRRPARPCSCR